MEKLTFEDLKNILKNKFPDKLVVEIPKNKTLFEKIEYIMRLYTGNNKKVILISDDIKLIRNYEKRKEFIYILFFYDEWLTLSNLSNNIYWVIKKMIDSNGEIAKCSICIEEKTNNIQKNFCCGCNICFDCKEKLFISGFLKCPICKSEN